MTAPRSSTPDTDDRQDCDEGNDDRRGVAEPEQPLEPAALSTAILARFALPRAERGSVDGRPMLAALSHFLVPLICPTPFR